jgi:hypothetical protein
LWNSGIFFLHDLFVVTFALIGWTHVMDFARMDATHNERLDGVRFF